MILKRLREETAVVHHRLEERMDMAAALETPAAYKRLVEKFYGLYVTLEPLLGAGVESIGLKLNWQERLKVPLLCRDLQVLGCSETDMETLPKCQILPSLVTPGRILGCLYVIEGSTLGGQVITKMIGSRLGFSAETGAAFFAGYGAATGERWRQCSEAITTACTPEMENDVIEGAAATFDAFEKWLTRD